MLPPVQRSRFPHCTQPLSSCGAQADITREACGGLLICSQLRPHKLCGKTSNRSGSAGNNLSPENKLLAGHTAIADLWGASGDCEPRPRVCPDARGQNITQENVPFLFMMLFSSHCQQVSVSIAFFSPNVFKKALTLIDF